MIKLLKKRNGFTLIELLITCVVVATGLFGLMVLYHNSARNVMDSNVNLAATYLARERLEQLISDKVSRGYDYLINSNYTTNDSVSVGNNFFSRSFNIYEVDGGDLSTPSPNSGYKRIDMMISWGMSSNQNITIPTLVAKYQ